MKPYRLVKDDSIGVISPAGPVKKEELEKGIRILKRLGFHIRLGLNVYALSQYDYMAGNDEKRWHDIHSMFIDKKIKAIISSRGGYGSMRLLEHIDYKAIQKNPKIFVGYSDITAIIMAIYKKTNLITFHGPMVRDLFRLPTIDVECLVNILEGKTNKISIKNSNIIIPGKGRGILLGGNLSMICHLVGTPFTPWTKEIILFVEDINEPYYKIDRMFTHLKMSGFLSHVSGLILGSFEKCGRQDIIEQIILERVSDMGFPVISGFPIGHGKRNITIPIGIEAELNVNNKEVIFLEKPVI